MQTSGAYFSPLRLIIAFASSSSVSRCRTIDSLSLPFTYMSWFAPCLLNVQPFFSRSSIKKQVRELERRYSYLDALLLGQDSQYIHRLEIISHTNLLYVEKYSEYVEVIEFYKSEYRQNVLYDIYFHDKKWSVQLREIIK